ncbi:MAG TPA: hypothetical protein VFV66_12475 [Nonomuraea sp.]|nr:hypothetical protein [Nonomuraea sp.]
MSTTRSAAVLASGTANAAKLFVGALVFTSAYVGLSAYGNAGTDAAPAAGHTGSTHTVTLSARELPITERLVPAAAGQVTVSALADGASGCARTYVARSVVANPDPADSVGYHWRLARWSPAARTWRTYLAEYDGFSGAGRTVEWRPRISGNPGWYRVEVTAEDAGTVTSGRFRMSC